MLVLGDHLLCLKHLRHLIHMLHLIPQIHLHCLIPQVHLEVTERLVCHLKGGSRPDSAPFGIRRLLSGQPGNLHRL